MAVNTLLKVLEQLLHKIKANRRREMLREGAREEVESTLGCNSNMGTKSLQILIGAMEQYQITI